MTLDRNTLLEAAKVCAEQFERDLPNQKSGGQSQDYSDGYLYGTYDCARAIRALAAAQPEGAVLVPRERIQAAMNELGVPRPGYPQPVANAYEILSAMLSAAGGKS